ncbi:MAG: hypothetical protein LBU12_05125, partial [Deltaproteobacteria bacterium]|nr:hypothetical protein [Deltaproteobacteria bacterium]
MRPGPWPAGRSPDGLAGSSAEPADLAGVAGSDRLGLSVNSVGAAAQGRLPEGASGSAGGPATPRRPEDRPEDQPEGRAA